MKHSPLCFLVVMLLMVACKPTVPSQYIQPDEMEEILYDYHVSQAMAKFEGGDKYEFRRNLYFQAVLKNAEAASYTWSVEGSGEVSEGQGTDTAAITYTGGGGHGGPGGW